LRHKKRTDEKGGKRSMSRCKRIICTGLLAWFLIFSAVPCPGEEKQGGPGTKETAKKSLPEKTKGKAREEWQNVKQDAKEAGREFKETGKQVADSAKKESKKTGEALKEAGREIKAGFQETFSGLKKLFKE
jgi:hypothetical protein